jgi:hypothetical protein
MTIGKLQLPVIEGSWSFFKAVTKLELGDKGRQ